MLIGVREACQIAFRRSADNLPYGVWLLDVLRSHAEHEQAYRAGAQQRGHAGVGSADGEDGRRVHSSDSAFSISLSSSEANLSVTGPMLSASAGRKNGCARARSVPSSTRCQCGVLPRLPVSGLPFGIGPRRVRTPTETIESPVWRKCLLRVLRSEEHTSELQSRGHLVCRRLLEKKNSNK